MRGLLFGVGRLGAGGGAAPERRCLSVARRAALFGGPVGAPESDILFDILLVYFWLGGFSGLSASPASRGGGVGVQG